MSRSIRKTMVFPICSSRGQKHWKKQYNRIYRRQCREAINRYLTDNNHDYNIGKVYLQKYANEWLSPSDGKLRYDMLDRHDFYNKPNRYSFNGISYQCDSYDSYESYVNEYKRLYLSK